MFLILTLGLKETCYDTDKMLKKEIKETKSLC